MFGPAGPEAGWQGQLQLLQAVCAGALHRPLFPEEEAGLREALKVLNQQPDEPTLPGVVDVLLHPSQEMAAAQRVRVLRECLVEFLPVLGLQHGFGEHWHDVLMGRVTYRNFAGGPSSPDTAFGGH